MSAGPDADWLLVAEIAARARMHPQTVYRHLRSGRLKGIQFAAHGNWRAHAADVEAWLRGEAPAVAAVPFRRRRA